MSLSIFGTEEGVGLEEAREETLEIFNKQVDDFWIAGLEDRSKR